MAWGVLYQTVNIGGWIGPLIALQMRHMSWSYVFYTNAAWFCVAGMAIFSIREMLASAKYSEFLGNIAPSDKNAMWIGFSQAPILLVWTIEGLWDPSWITCSPPRT